MWLCNKVLTLTISRAKRQSHVSLLSARNIDPENLGVITDIADLYADTGLLELSNKFWFLYLNKAPKEKRALAYEELAINYFYLENFWASSYYFHQKLSVDGFISKEGLSQEIIDFFYVFYLIFP